MDNATAPCPSLLLNLDEVATELRCTRRSVERHIADHRLPVIWIGRSVRIERQALEAFIAASAHPTMATRRFVFDRSLNMRCPACGKRPKAEE
jgi:excisionase family DNA binding protein